ncbi:hypothetical protein J6S88_06750 [bacterium]|nr:hypothetical protein [bacterium]
MEETKNLVTLNEEITIKLYEAVDILNALDEIVDGHRTIEPLLRFVKTNVSKALDAAEECKTIICD